MLSDGFRDTGFDFYRVGDTPLTRFQVLGERSSGTNYLKRLMGRNSGLKPTEYLGWKHGFTQAIAVPTDLAVICALRDARAWVLSMHSKPWHTPPAMQEMTFSEFIRTPWTTIIDRDRYFPEAQKAPLRDTPLLQDRDPLTGEAYANIFALRTAKLRFLLGFQNRGASVAYVRMEAATADPHAYLDALRSAWSLPEPDGPFRPVMKRLGSKFKPSVNHRPATPYTMSTEDLAFMKDNLDLELEAALGYTY